MSAFQVFPCLITLGGVVIKLMERQLLLKTGLGWSNSLGLCRPTSLGLHVFFELARSIAGLRCCAHTHTLTCVRNNNNNNYNLEAPFSQVRSLHPALESWGFLPSRRPNPNPKSHPGLCGTLVGLGKDTHGPPVPLRRKAVGGPTNASRDTTAQDQDRP